MCVPSDNRVSGRVGITGRPMRGSRRKRARGAPAPGVGHADMDMQRIDRSEIRTPRLRALCPGCLESFTPEDEDPAGAACPRCARAARGPEAPAATGPRDPVRPEDEDEPVLALIPHLVQDARAWCRGRAWWARAPLLLYFVYGMWMHLSTSEPYRTLFDGINLGIHELGHVLFAPFGELLTAAGGTITQCAAPVAAAFVFLRQRDYFGIAVAWCWLATNLYGVAVYAADARALQLNLVAPGMGMVPASEGTISHDWEFLLGQLGWLQHTEVIAGAFRLSAFVSMAVGVAFGGWLLWRMAVDREQA